MLFRSLHPSLGVVQAGETRFTVADVPGLIEGASEGKGLGLQFLRHVERCAALLHVLDCATLEPGRDPISDLDLILKELEKYEVPEGEVPLQERPQLVALNKIDVPEARELAEFVKGDLEARGYKVFLISAVSHEGLRELNFALAELVKQDRSSKANIPAKPRIHLMNIRKDDSKFTVTKEEVEDEEIFRVVGTKPERWVAQTMFNNEEAVGFLGDRLAKLGVEDALLKAGAVAGSEVLIGGEQNSVVFDWQPTLVELHQGPRGTDERLVDNNRPGAAERLAAHRERQYGTGEPIELRSEEHTSELQSH